ncbi:GNAT family N-acetyltransferase [Hymenobacter elongatus]|uniref:GNAT family N-acetyltransferase n=1 Tax=Hymenobacter elongatus TaxID=877208 RepID=A0A4Z0PKP6_9BACT|nr:GNAT family N-acetyltransferase [Hymenobacter elongatus]TGE15810.1 GNAT family N-acetyltransferase [Hymenobacter elongatus]
MILTWTSKKFTNLTLAELYDLLQLRMAVFIVEQNCPFQDIDGKDADAYHLLGYTEQGRLAAYARLFDAGHYYEQVSIGRVAVSLDYRRYGFGKALMQQAITHCETLFGSQPIKIGAQQYLMAFYQSFGFMQLGEMYLEDDIPHIYMVRS